VYLGIFHSKKISLLNKKKKKKIIAVIPHIHELMLQVGSFWIIMLSFKFRAQQTLRLGEYKKICV